MTILWDWSAVEQIQFGRVVIPNLTLPGNSGSNLILVTEIEIQFVFSGRIEEITTDTTAGEHLPPAAQRGVVCHRPPIPGSNSAVLFKTRATTNDDEVHHGIPV